MEDNILVVTKEQALEILEEKNINKYFKNNNIDNLYYTSIFILLAVVGVAFILAAILLVVFLPIFLLEAIYKKISNRKKKNNEINDTNHEK